MRVLIQRVSKAEVRSEGREAAGIGRGLLVFVGVGRDDGEDAARRLAEKTARLRIFSNAAGKFDLSLLDVKGEALVVSQFTLFGDCRKGRRPDFTAAMAPERAEALYLEYVGVLRELGVGVRTGEFGAKMEVELINDGPVTLWLDSGAA